MKRFLIGIDGNCGSGKTTLSEIIREQFDCNIFHMDDYYLPFSGRANDWEMIPAGNMDLERFLHQVIIPAKRGDAVCYQPYDCRRDRLKDGVVVTPKMITIVEGSYSHHPLLASHYECKIFLSCSKAEQKRRLLLREGERYSFYEKRWIPMEERYYQAYEIKEHADKVFVTHEYETYARIVTLLKRHLESDCAR